VFFSQYVGCRLRRQERDHVGLSAACATVLIAGRTILAVQYRIVIFSYDFFLTFPPSVPAKVPLSEDIFRFVKRAADAAVRSGARSPRVCRLADIFLILNSGTMIHYSRAAARRVCDHRSDIFTDSAMRHLSDYRCLILYPRCTRDVKADRMPRRHFLTRSSDILSFYFRFFLEIIFQRLQFSCQLILFLHRAPSLIFTVLLHPSSNTSPFQSFFLSSSEWHLLTEWRGACHNGLPDARWCR